MRIPVTPHAHHGRSAHHRNRGIRLPDDDRWHAESWDSAFGPQKRNNIRLSKICRTRRPRRRHLRKTRRPNHRRPTTRKDSPQRGTNSRGKVTAPKELFHWHKLWHPYHDARSPFDFAPEPFCGRAYRRIGWWSFDI